MEILIVIIVIGIVAFFVFSHGSKPSQEELIAFKEEVRELLKVQPDDSKKLAEYKNEQWKSLEGGINLMINGEGSITRSEFNAHKYGSRNHLAEHITVLEKRKVALIKRMEDYLESMDSGRFFLVRLRKMERNEENDNSIDALEKQQEHLEISRAEIIQALADLGYEYKLQVIATPSDASSEQ